MTFYEHISNVISKIEADKLMDAINKETIKCLRVNTLYLDPLDLKNSYPNIKENENIPYSFYYDKNEYDLGKSIEHFAGGIYIQDASAMLVAHLLEPKENERIIDLCAAPGGKATQVAILMNNSGLVIANDYNDKRSDILSENVERLGITNTIVLNNKIDTIANHFGGYFDKVILDAPCSGEGMFRKNSLTYDDWTYDKTLNLAKIQKDLILKAYRCLKKDGVMVYSTCTFATEENEEVIKYLLDNTNASIIPIKKEKDFDGSILKVDGAVRLYPFNFEGEGHFICLVKCNDDHFNHLKMGNKEASRKDMELYRAFEEDNLNISLSGNFVKMGDELHLLPNDCFCLDRFKVLRNGIHLGTIKEKRFEPNHALALYLKKEEVKNCLDFSYNSKEIKDYLKGFTLETINKKGYVLICVEGISLGWCKDDGRLIKNLYPKGLRVQE